jgi:hypothetical protein
MFESLSKRNSDFEDGADRQTEAEEAEEPKAPALVRDRYITEGSQRGE